MDTRGKTTSRNTDSIPETPVTTPPPPVHDPTNRPQILSTSPSESQTEKTKTTTAIKTPISSPSLILVSNSTATKDVGEDETLNVLVEAVKSLTAQIQNREAKTDVSPIVAAPAAKTMISKFAPNRINSKFVEQSIDQLESWMDINGIKDDKEKFQILKISIEPETYREVASAIKTAPSMQQYNTLKEAIIKAYTDSEHMRIKSLLSGLSLGDRRPSQLLTEMTNLYQGPRDSIFKELFFSRLPATVRAILTSMINNANTEPSISTVAQWADEIYEQIKEPRIEALSEDKSDHKQIGSALDSIIKLLSQISTSSFPRRPSSVNRFDNRQSKNTDRYTPTTYGVLPNDGICQYHRQFGNNKHQNKKCLPECKLNAKWLQANSKNSKGQ